MVNSEKPRRRIAFVLIDGVGDVSLPRFAHKTPLQVAKVPNLDGIASAGVNGLMDPVEVGLACGSDTAHLSLLGYDPRVYYRGRGAFESMGAGLAMSPGDIAFKSNFATLDEQTGIVISRRADRHFEEEGPILCAALDGLKLSLFPQYEVRVRYATEHRCGVVLKGPNLSGNISGTNPLKDNRLLLQAEALDDTDEAKHTAAVVNELSKEISRILISHPLNVKRAAEGKNIANVVLLRGCGIRIEKNIMGRSKQMKRKGRKREEKKRIRIPSINSLPSELMTEILGRVAAYSFSDLLNAKSSCKFFHEAATDNYIFQRLSLEMVPVVLWHTRNEVSRLLERCKKSGNPEALYRQGVVDYFSLRSPSPESGLETLKKAAKMGHKGAMYVLAVVLLSSDDDYFRREGVELLREIEKSKARDCRDDLGAIVGAIWVRNPFDPKWRSSSYCNEQGVEHRRSRPGWESDDDDSVRCHACRCDREVACVMDMFSYI